MKERKHCLKWIIEQLISNVFTIDWVSILTLDDDFLWFYGIFIKNFTNVIFFHQFQVNQKKKGGTTAKKKTKKQQKVSFEHQHHEYDVCAISMNEWMK